VSIATFAKDIGCNVRTLQSFAQLAAFYPPDTRDEFENISFSHYKLAHRYSDKSLDTALALLEVASSQGLSCEAFEQHLRESRLSEVQALKALLLDCLDALKPSGGHEQLVARIEGVL